MHMPTETNSKSILVKCPCMPALEHNMVMLAPTKPPSLQVQILNSIRANPHTLNPTHLGVGHQPRHSSQEAAVLLQEAVNLLKHHHRPLYCPLISGQGLCLLRC